MSDHTFTRRSTLAKFGGIVAAAAGGRALLTDDAAGGNLAVESGAVACVLTPELTEGPYYIAGEKLRRDIREGHPGTLLSLRLRVLNASTCKPIKGAAVDIGSRRRREGRTTRASANPLCLAALSCAGSRRPTPPASPSSQRFTRAGTRVAPSTSTSRCTSAARSCTRGSCSSRTR